ncbi:MAG: MATE family efflux transporter [Armatimonadota bacterium]|nr:MATE family efflux transporter [bacterium]MDW8320919.1 MATE family efflux transporter [Armatimonadota bacterium]
MPEPTSNSAEALHRLASPDVELARAMLPPALRTQEAVSWRAIAHDVWNISIPAVTTNLLQTTNAFLDRMFVGRLGRDALAAVGVAGQGLFLLMAVSFIVGTGTTALIARFVGGQNLDDARKALRQSLALGAAMGTVCMALGYLLAKPAFGLMGMEPSAERATLTFFFIALLGIVPLFTGQALGAALRGMGDMRTPLKVMLWVNVVHIVLDFALIFGVGPFPRMGLAGAATALTLSQWFGFTMFWFALRKHPVMGEAVRFQRLEMVWAKRIFRIGAPASLQALLRISSMLGYTRILSATPQGTAALAALPIGMTAESIAFMPGLGYSMAATTLVGQSLGAKRPDVAARYAWMATAQACLIMTIMGVVFYVFAYPFARWFTHDSLVVEVSADYLRINAYSEPFLALAMVLSGAFQGAGDTRTPTGITFVTMWLLRLPLAYLLALTLGYGTHGAWWAMAASVMAAGLISALLFQRGGWKQVKV